MKWLLVKNLIKSSSVYAGGNLIARAIPFMLLPILTRFLSSEDYGVLAIFMAIFGVMEIFISMGTTDAIVRAYFDIADKKKDFPEYVFNGLLINVAVFVAVFLAWHSGKPYLAKAIPIPFGYQLLIPLLGLCVAIYSMPCKLWVFRKQPLPFIIFNFSNTFLEVATAIFLIVFMRFNWQGRVLGIAVSKLTFLFIGIYFLQKYKFFKPSLNIARVKEILGYGFPVVLHSSGFVIVAVIDKIFLNKFVGLSTTGVYSVSYSVCSIIAFLIGAFNLAWVPILYEKLGNLSIASKGKLVRLTYIYFALILAGTLLFIIISPSIVNIVVGKSFLEAKMFIPWLALGFSFHGMYVMVVNYVFYAKETKILSKIAILTVILSFLSNYILIKINGAIGVAQATCLVFLSRFLLVWFFSNKVYPLPWFSFARIRQIG
jgi:O-antigen/teichoic acid export membrane protein